MAGHRLTADSFFMFALSTSANTNPESAPSLGLDVPLDDTVAGHGDLSGEDAPLEEDLPNRNVRHGELVLEVPSPVFFRTPSGSDLEHLLSLLPLDPHRLRKGGNSQAAPPSAKRFKEELDSPSRKPALELPSTQEYPSFPLQPSLFDSSSSASDAGAAPAQVGLQHGLSGRSGSESAGSHDASGASGSDYDKWAGFDIHSSSHEYTSSA